MCGILAFAGDNTPKNLKLIHDLMLQLSLRGTHATGFAIQTKGPLDILQAPVGAEAFLAQFPMDFLLPNHKQPIRLIGHTRYSTSDLEWNQPLERDGTALVMNGVISQEFPHDWPMAEVFDYQTGNDAEVALMYALNGQRGHMPGSFAIAELNEADILVYRNTDRPLWWGRGEDYSVVASTQDALKRCRVPEIQFMRPGRVNVLLPNGIVTLIDQMDYRPHVVQLLGDSPATEATDAELLGELPVPDFPFDELDQQDNLPYEGLQCLL